MNVSFLNPFVEAAAEVLETEAGVTMTRGTLEVQKSALTTDDVTIIINIVGDIVGAVLLGMSEKTGLALVSGIIGDTFDKWDSLTQSGVAELSNVIVGRACVKLSKAGYDVNISPPVLITGNGVMISTFDFNRIVVPLETTSGSLLVHLALRERTADTPADPTNLIPALSLGE